ncbi:MAG: hypothetical protein ACI89X_001909 [Planctomycetota bacterium]|jgi:hypothetical protein
MNPSTTTAFVLSLAVAASLAGQKPGEAGKVSLPQNPTQKAPLLKGPILRGEVRPKAPMAAAWYDARATANQFKAPLLAFVLPEVTAKADAKRIVATREAEKQAHMLVTMFGSGAPPIRTARDLLLRQVQLLRGSQKGTLGELPKATDEQMVFALTVPVFVTAKACGAKANENVVLLSPYGKRLDGWRLDLLDGDAFVKAVGEHVFAEASLGPRQANVHGPSKQLLVGLRARIAAKGPGGLAPYFAQQMHEKLASNLVALGPALVRRKGDKVVAEAELSGIETSRAPFGSKGHMELGDPCPGCGMGYTPPGLMTVLRLIAR